MNERTVLFSLYCLIYVNADNTVLWNMWSLCLLWNIIIGLNIWIYFIFQNKTALFPYIKFWKEVNRIISLHYLTILHLLHCLTTLNYILCFPWLHHLLLSLFLNYPELHFISTDNFVSRWFQRCFYERNEECKPERRRMRYVWTDS
jgi:hypothetical protein